jgi:sporulation protein YabP
MQEGSQNNNHRLSLEKRERMDIGGVREVVSFDDVSVILKTDCGEMIIEGEKLKIGVLDTDKGVVELGGRIDAVYYSQTGEVKRGKLFRKNR